MIFDCSKPVELRAKYIFITNGGRLQVSLGSEVIKLYSCSTPLSMKF